MFWGAAIVFFLAKIINLHNPNTQGFWVEVSSQVVCGTPSDASIRSKDRRIHGLMTGLFTVTSVGFIPSRVLSTWRTYRSRPIILDRNSFSSGIWRIWRYKKLTIQRRKDAGLPQLFDPDDLPDPEYDPNFVRVLSEDEHHDLHRRESPSCVNSFYHAD